MDSSAPLSEYTENWMDRHRQQLDFEMPTYIFQYYIILYHTISYCMILYYIICSYSRL